VANHLLLTPFLCSALLLAGCAVAKGPPLPTVDGPETLDLVQGVGGHIVMDRPVGGIVAVSLPALKEVVVRAPDQGEPIHSLSGPDAAGRIAYVEWAGSPEARGHRLKVIGLDGQGDREIFSRPGDTGFVPGGYGPSGAVPAGDKRGPWDQLIGSELALAPAGGQVAFVSKLKGVQMHNPSAHLDVGSLEVWDVANETGREAGTTALDASLLSWFPDGKRLAYAELVSRDQLGKVAEDLGDFLAGFGRWDKIPAVHVLDVATGKKSLLHPGWDPVVSADGKTVLVKNFDGRYRRVEVQSRKSRAVEWPGGWGSAIALLDGHLVLYWGLPTTGAPPRYTEHNSPLRGPKPMLTLKLAQVDSKKFQTVVPFIDPRCKVSFGVAKAPR
jgi:hypothetical protein